MKNNIIKLIAILACICIVCGVLIKLNKDNEENQKIDNTKTNENITSDFIDDDNKIEGDKEMISNIKVIINEKTYSATIEDNETAKMFVNILPQEFDMTELNGNEKYIYLDDTFKVDSYNPKHIEAGDIMLYGNNCLVVFYKSFNTSYSYTKIGHIDNLPDLGSKNITIKFEK